MIVFTVNHVKFEVKQEQIKLKIVCEPLSSATYNKSYLIN